MKLWSSSMTLKQSTAVFNGKIEFIQGNIKTKCQNNTHLLSLQQMYYKLVLPK